MPDTDYTQQIADLQALIEREKERGRLHSGAPSGIDGASPRRMSAGERAAMEEAIARGNVDAYQPPSAQRMEETARAMREVSGNTIRERHYEAMGEALKNYNANSPDQAVLRLQRNTLEEVQKINAERGVEPIRSAPTPTSVDNTPALRTEATSGNRAPLRAIDPPRSASPSTWQGRAPTLTPEVPTPLNIPQRIGSRLSSLPESAGLSSGYVRGAGIVAGIDLGIRLASGEDPGLAAASSAGSFIGGLVGGAVGTLIGPEGTWVGGAIGGYIGGSVGSGLFNALHPPEASTSGQSPDLQQLQVAPQNLSVVGGGRHTTYAVYWTVTQTYTNGSAPFQTSYYSPSVWGSIKGIKSYQSGSNYITAIMGGSAASKDSFNEYQIGSFPGPPVGNQPTIWITNCVPEDGGSNPGSEYTAAQPIGINRILVSPHTGTSHPLNSPTQAYAPNPTPDRGGRPTGDAPMLPPTAERLAPGSTSAAPSNLGKQLPQNKPVGVPTPEQAERHNPGHQARSESTSQGGVRMLGQNPSPHYDESFGQYQNRLLAGTGGQINSAAHASDLSPLVQVAVPAAILTTLIANPQTTGLLEGPPQTTPIGTGNPNTPQTQPQTSGTTTSGTDTGTGSTEGFCRFHEDTVSHQKLDTQFTKLELIEAVQAAFQASMDRKLGPELPNGGIAGKLGRLGGLASKTWNFLQVDRALAIFSWIGVLHNAYMLSNNLGQTLFSAISTSLDAVGIQKVDDEGNEEPYDVGEIVAKYTDNFAKNLFGVSTWEGIKSDWKKLNRIYQAATNLLNSLQSMTYAVLEGLETVGNYVAKIGNAARIFGVFTEKAFNPMRDNLNFKGGRFFRFLERSEEFVENIESISSNVVDIQQTAADCSDQATELKKGITDFEKSRSDEEKQKKVNSVSPPIAVADQQKPES